MIEASFYIIDSADDPFWPFDTRGKFCSLYYEQISNGVKTKERKAIIERKYANEIIKGMKEWLEKAE